MSKRKSIGLVLVSFVLGSLVTLGVSYGLTGSVDRIFGGSDFAYVDMHKIVRQDPFFKRAQSRWRRDRRRLLGHYATQLRKLQKSSVRAGSEILNLLGSEVQSSSQERSSRATHRHSSRGSVKGLNRSRRLVEQLKTVMTRKKRAENVLSREQRELNERGERRIVNASRELAERKGLDFVLEKVDFVYSRTTADTRTLLPDEHNVTDEVIRNLSRKQ